MVNCDQFQILQSYTRSYSSHLFLCALVSYYTGAQNTHTLRYIHTHPVTQTNNIVTAVIPVTGRLVSSEAVSVVVALITTPIKWRPCEIIVMETLDHSWSTKINSFLMLSFLFGTSDYILCGYPRGQCYRL